MVLVINKINKLDEYLHIYLSRIYLVLNYVYLETSNNLKKFKKN